MTIILAFIRIHAVYWLMPKHPEKNRLLQMRVSGDFLRTVDDWRRKQPELPSRSEAIRRLVQQALTSRTTKLRARARSIERYQ
jgi:hypothetical protein